MSPATERVLAAITATPGIGLLEAAQAADVTVDSMYREHLPALKKDRRVVTGWSGRRWFAWPLPGCTCPSGYVRDVCSGHPAEDCAFKGLFGRELADAHETAMDRLACFGAGESMRRTA